MSERVKGKRREGEDLLARVARCALGFHVCSVCMQNLDQCHWPACVCPCVRLGGPLTLLDRAPHTTHNNDNLHLLSFSPTHTHKNTLGFHVLWGLSIDVMILILYSLYIVFPISHLNLTLIQTVLHFLNKHHCLIYKLFFSLGPNKWSKMTGTTIFVLHLVPILYRLPGTHTLILPLHLSCQFSSFFCANLSHLFMVLL